MAEEKKVQQKKAEAKAEVKVEEKKKTLSEKLNDINFKNKNAQEISSMQAENKKLKDIIIAQKKSSRGPSNSTRISGLQTLNPNLGQQFSKQ